MFIKDYSVLYFVYEFNIFLRMCAIFLARELGVQSPSGLESFAAISNFEEFYFGFGLDWLDCAKQKHKT